MTDEVVGAQTLVIGARGLLGAAVVRSLLRNGQAVRHVEVPWHDSPRAVEALLAAVSDLAAQGQPWRVMWCAGAGVIGTSQERLEAELSTLRRFLDGLAIASTVVGAPEVLFYASSAGGLYAGSLDPPFTERTTPAPISPYGHAKVEAERLVSAFADRSGVPVLLGRIANLYGPGQDLNKAQGLVTQLCRAHIERRPISIYVSLDTSRDYLYVDDGARLAVASLSRAALRPAGTVSTKILASQRGTTVSSMLGELRRITKHRPQVVLGSSPLTKFQTRDLRFRSCIWPDLDRLVTTSLPAGMFATMQDLTLQSLAPRLVEDGVLYVTH